MIAIAIVATDMDEIFGYFMNLDKDGDYIFGDVEQSITTYSTSGGEIPHFSLKEVKHDTVENSSRQCDQSI